MNTVIALTVIGLVILMAGLFNRNKLLLPAGIIGVLLSAALMINDYDTALRYYNDMVFFDNYAILFSLVMMVSGLLIFPLFTEYHDEFDIPLADALTLLVFALIGAVIMVSFSHLVMLFLGIEILSISMYILAGSKKRELASNEAALKYFLMGAFASGFLLFGIALIYGHTGSFHLQAIADVVIADRGDSGILYAGILLVVVGLGFKISAVPFHFWAPDVYYGSPNLVTVFMTTVVKTAAVASFFRLFATCFSNEVSEVWAPVLAVSAILTMSIGNITAIFQHNFKRMLAYSSIAHAGYLMIALVALDESSSRAILIYTFAYSAATIGAFAGLITVYNSFGKDHFESYNGLNSRSPLLAFTILLSMLSLAGIPPTGGFFGKFYIFSAALNKGYTLLVIIAALNSAISLYYYFKVIIAMYFKPVVEDHEKSIVLGFPYKIVLIVVIALILVLGIFPSYIASLI